MTLEIAADARNRLERLAMLARTLEAGCVESAAARQLIEHVLEELDELKRTLQSVNYP